MRKLNPSPSLSSIALAGKLLIAGLILHSVSMSASAGPLPLAEAPAGTSGREPSPNVIISVDDSGSMDWAADGSTASSTKPSRMTSLKAALLSQFGDPSNPAIPGRLEDGRIRLAWQSMWASSYMPSSTTTNLGLGVVNSMKPFQGGHRTAFANFVNALDGYSNTAAHLMYQRAYNYMRSPVHVSSPWADNPGTAQSTPYLSCRRTYHIFMTDGGWNANNSQSVGNADGSYRMLPDGINAFNPYPTAAPPISQQQFNVYKDTFGGPSLTQLSTVSDLAFAAWATDLQDGTGGTANMGNNVRPLIRKPGTETVGQVQLQEFWNPKNDPATWQHIVSHTIGFGTGAIQWKNKSNTVLVRPYWDTITNNNYGGDYENLVNGVVSWPDPISALDEDGRPVELWHSAINGRGKFYPAKDATALQAAFSDILDNVINDTSTPLVSIAANGPTVTGDSAAYIAGYRGGEWSGYVKAYKIDTTGLDVTPLWDTSTILDNVLTPSTRTILTSDGSGGIPFQWASLSTAAPAVQRTALNSTDNRGSDRVDYLRGVRTLEGSAATTFRTRKTIHGDVVNSNVTYLGRPRAGSNLAGYRTFAGSKSSRTPMIYVGANDGMLHAFDASAGADKGKEKLAYVPQGVYGKLASYTSQTYTHTYTVDGTPMTGDVLVGADNWRTYLAGFLGAGGKGFFVLDVTDPAQFSESNAASLVVLDQTATSDPDVGNMFAQATKHPANPYQSLQFTMMNNGRPALILGNGLNSANERPVLLIQFLNGAKELVKLVASTQTGTGNGLSNTQILDLNNDGKADVVYAGDLLGNMWKFDISAAAATTWGVALGGAPLFSAKNAAGAPQPITAAPVWLSNPRGGLQIGFGTGRNVTIGDRTDASEQTFYSVWDNSVINRTPTGVSFTHTSANIVSGGRSELVEQTMGTAAVASYGGRSFFNSAAPVAVNYSATGTLPRNRKGWYMRFTEPKERAIMSPYLYARNFVVVPTLIPATGTESNTETCSPAATGEVGYLTVVDLINGEAPKKPVFDTNGGGFTGTETVANKISNIGGDSIRVGGTDGTSQFIGPSGGGVGESPPRVPGVSSAWRDR